MTLAGRSSILKRAGASSFLASLAMFTCLSALIGLLHPLSRINTVNLERGESFNALASLQKEMAAQNTKQDQCLLFGSSLVLAPALQDEAAFRNAPFKRFFERRLTALESDLEHKKRVYLLAVGGEMASDAFFVAQQLLDSPAFKNGGGTKTIVYGIAPRDFSDNLFPRVDASPIFRLHAGLRDLPFYFGRHWRQVDFNQSATIVCEKLNSLYCMRTDWQSLAQIRAKRALEKILPMVVFEKYSDSLELKAQRRGLLPGEAIGTPQVYPGFALEHNDSQKTHAEYIRRYTPYDKSKADVQFAYLDRFISLAREHGIDVTLVNMPLSRRNMSIMPIDAYSDYLARVKATAIKGGARLVDLNQGEMQNDDRYADTVHMKPAVSREFMQIMAGVIGGKIDGNRSVSVLNGNRQY